MEIRQTLLYKPLNNLPDGWESIRLIAHLHRVFMRKGKLHKTNSIYVSDLDTDDAHLIAKGIRSHWLIENKLH
jgi:predicted transposase YbfD/YdcC